MPRRSEHTVAGVYAITCLQSGKVYVGRSINVQKRWTRHRWELERGTHRNRHLQNAWAKHGPDAFTFEILITIPGDPDAEMDALLGMAEVWALRRYPSTFNLMEAGAPALTASDETRAKLSGLRKEMWADPAYKARLRETQTAKHQDAEFSERRAEAIRQARRTDQQRADTSAKSKEKWAPGGVLRETQGARRRANWADPLYCAQQKASREAAWADPEVRARRSAGLKAAWARRRAAKKTPPE